MQSYLASSQAKSLSYLLLFDLLMIASLCCTYVDEHGDKHHNEGAGGYVFGDDVEEEDYLKVEEPV